MHENWEGPQNAVINKEQNSPSALNPRQEQGLDS